MRSPVPKKISPFIQLYMLPQIVKLLIALGLFLIILVTGFLMLYHESYGQLERLGKKRQELEHEVSKEAKNYGALMYLAKQTELAKKSAEDLVKKLPPESKVYLLLENITKLGTSQGLKFIYFRPGQAVNHEFYIALPVQVSVTGDFHQIAQFLSGLANLPDSLVSVNEFDLYRPSNTQKTLIIQFVATLYYSGKGATEQKS